MRPMTGPAAEPNPDVVQERMWPFLRDDYGDYFSAMLADPDACLSAAILTKAEASRIRARVALIHGRLDRACLVSNILTELAPLLPDADLTLLGGCGHNVIAERTADVIAAIARFVEKNDPQ
jgi:pimeloyl-ACP methyl ester carboxylesterase